MAIKIVKYAYQCLHIQKLSDVLANNSLPVRRCVNCIEYRYFSNMTDANNFVATISDGTTVTIRNTNLEDCFVELTRMVGVL